MREILFRGKTKNGDWAEGNLLVYPDVNRTYIQKGDYFKGGAIEVKRSTVGQYTGLNDKNGKRIFEGDIVKTSDVTHEDVIQIPGDTFEIAMKKGCWMMVAGTNWDFLETNHGCVEVIGNIYNNPELLKGGDG